MQKPFSTRLTMNNILLDRLPAIKVLGVWIQADLNWETNTKQLCKSAFSRISILSKLKYAGVKRDDLLLVYKMFIRSIPEYCSVVFNSSLTIEQSEKLEAIQSTSLKIILGDAYMSYNSAMQEVGLERLSTRRERRMESFAVKCVKNSHNKKMFPLNPNASAKEKFIVNFARTSRYMRSTIPQCQRLLNKLVIKKNLSKHIIICIYVRTR